MAQVTQKIRLDFTASGLDQIEKTLGETVPFLNKKKSAEVLSGLKSQIDALRSISSKAGGEFSTEGAQMFLKDYKKLIRDFKNITTSLNFAPSPELEQQRVKAEKISSELEKTITAYKQLLTASRRNVTEDEAGKRTVTAKFRDTAFKSLTKDTSIDGIEEPLTMSGKNTSNYETWLKTITQIKDVAKFLNISQEELISGEKQLTEEQIKSYNEAHKSSTLKLDGKQAVEQLIMYKQVEAGIEGQATIELQKQKNIERDIQIQNQKLIQSKEQELKIQSNIVEKAKETGDPKNAEIIQKVYETSANSAIEAGKAEEQLSEKVKKTNEEIKEKGNLVKKTSTDFAHAAKNVFSYGLAFQFLRRIYRETIRTIKDLDHALTEMAVVTSMNREQTWQLLGTFQDLAKQTGFTTTEIAKLSTIYFRQGRALKDVIELTEVAAKAARVAGISAVESANYLTAAVNGFGLAASEAERVSDKFAALAASSASSYEELAVGLSKFASQAKIAGLEMDFAIGLLAKGVETTREAPESVGTALKTVIARMRELTDLGKTFEDGMDLNRVETALKQVGVQLRDTNGQFREMQDVLVEVGIKWEGLNKNQQASIAVALAGTRQQSRLVAMFQDFDRTLQLVDISQESAGATMAQHAQFMQGMEAAMVGLQTAWQGFITTITESETIIDIVNVISEGIDSLSKTLKSLGISGKNFVVVLISTLAVVKALSIANKIYSAVLAKQSVLKGKMLLNHVWENKLSLKELTIKYGLIKGTWLHLFAQKAEFISTQSLIISKTILLAVSLALVGIAALLVIGIMKMVKANREERRSLQEKNAEYQITRYELNKTSKTMDELIKKYDELNSKAIKTDEDVVALQELGEQLKEIDGLDVVYSVWDGSIDLEGNIQKLKDLRAAQEALVDETFLKEYQNASKEYQKLSRQQLAFADESIHWIAQLGFAINSGKTGQIHTNKNNLEEVEKNQREFLKENSGFFTNYLTNEFRRAANLDLSKEQADILQKFYESILTVENANLLASDKEEDQDAKNALIKSLQRQAGDYLETAQPIYEAINKAADISFNHQLTTYRELINGLKDGDGLKEALAEDFAALEFFLGVFEDFEEIPDIFEKVGMNTETINNLSIAAKKAGLGIEEMLQDIALRKNLIIEANKGIDPVLAQAKAYAEVANNIQDSTVKAQLYNIAMRNTTQEVAQRVDTVTSRLKNINDVQKQILEGTISASDIFDFTQRNQDIFQDQGIFDKFLKGESIELDLINSALEQRAQYEENLLLVQEELLQLNEKKIRQGGVLNEADSARVGALVAQTNELVLLMRYNGELANVTQSEYEYNKAKEQQNKLKELGITNNELEQASLAALSETTAEVIRRTSENIETLQKSISTDMKQDWQDIFKIINGVVVFQEGAVDLIGEENLVQAQLFADSLQTNYDQQIEWFNKLKNEELRIAKEANDKKRKVYEDYFKALDRLEDKREKKLSREQIVQQLQRLEGATDAASQKRAKDLRADLIKFDESTKKDEQKQARQDLISSLDDNLIKIEKEWADSAQKFVDAMALGGTTAGEAMLEAMGLTGSGSGFNNRIVDPKTVVGNTVGVSSSGSTHEGYGNKDALKLMFESKMLEKPLMASYLSHLMNDVLRLNREDTDISDEQFDSWAQRISSFRKGGTVDYTGLAMVHGSSLSPEAFLNANQTEMFSNLTKALSKVSVSGGNSESINIENITIQTQSLNNKQDFNAAGKVLAEAFSSAISKRGISVNTKR